MISNIICGKGINPTVHFRIDLQMPMNSYFKAFKIEGRI